MGKKISQLSGAGSAATTMKVEVENNSGVSQYVTLQQIYDAASFTLADGDYGDISVASGVWTIDANVVTNAKLAQAPANTLKGNNTGATANVADLTASQVKSLLAIAQSDVSGLTASLAAKADLVGGKVPSSQLPSYVDDIEEYANLASFPVTGETGKLYVTQDTNRIYRWTGSAYVEVSAGSGAGTVTSVGLSLPAIFSVSGSPVTTSGTITATLANQNANQFWAGPTSGGAATPTFRALVAADLPTVPIAQGGTGLTATPTNGQLPIGNGSGYSLATLTAGSNITITNASGAITIAASGGGGGTPAGSDTQVQYNNASAFGATSNFIVDTGGTNTALVRATSPSNTKPALRLQSNGSGQTAAVLAVTDGVIDVCRIMRDGTINDATWGGNTIPTTKGGTGLTTLGTAGQTYRVNSGATGLEWFSGAAFGSQSSAVATGTLANGASVDVTHASDPGFVRIPKFEVLVGVPTFACSFEGTNGSTTFTDLSSFGATLTANGNAQISTAQFRSGTSSGLFDGTGDFVDTAANRSQFNIGSNNFTIECWFRVANTTGVKALFAITRPDATDPSHGAVLAYVTGSQVGGSFWSNTTNGVAIGNGGTVVANTWHHYAMTRSGTTLRCFLDGTQVSSITDSGSLYFDSQFIARIGRYITSVPYDFNGHIDELVFLNGTAKYTSTFTPSNTLITGTWQPVKLSNSLIADTDCVDVQYADLLGNNSSTVTRFTNRLGSSVTYRASVLLGSAPAGMLGPVGAEKTASFTGTIGQIDPVNLSSVGSDLTATAPATVSNGDWFGYYVSGRNLDWKLTLNRNGNTINGDTSVSSFTLQERGDHAVWRYLSGTWVPVTLRRTSLTPTVPSLPGLQLWLDSSDSSTLYDATSGGSLVAADGAIARWEDKSGNSRHAIQATLSNRPLRKTSIQNGKDIVQFDGSNDWLSIGSSQSLFNYLHGGGTGYSIFAVFRVRASVIRQGILHTGAGGSPSGDSGSIGAVLYADGSGGSVVYNVWNGTTSPRPITNTLSSAITVNSFLTISNTGTANSGTASIRSSLRKNGGTATTGNTATSTTNSGNSSQDFRIGRWIAYNGDGSTDFDVYATIDLAELIICNVDVGSTLVGTTNTYLTNKWATT